MVWKKKETFLGGQQREGVYIGDYQIKDTEICPELGSKGVIIRGQLTPQKHGVTANNHNNTWVR